METKAYDVVVIGAGGAGIAAAAVASHLGARVALLSKEPAGRGNTAISGGIMSNPGLTPGDSPDQFKQDLVRGGEHTGDPALIETVAEGASAATALLEGFGTIFLRDETGELGADTVIRQGGHTYPRTMYLGAGRGIAIGAATRAAAARGSLDVYEEVVAASLLKENGRVGGVVALELLTGEPLAFTAGAVILATGGYPWIYYPRSDAMRSTIGDGCALAYWAGAELLDMEQIQWGTEPGFYGPHARLLNADGEVVRDSIGYVTRAEMGRIIALEVAKGKGTPGGGLILDPRPNLEHADGRETFRKVKASGMLELVSRRGNAAAARWEDTLELRCRAHFTMGGVRADAWGRTTVPGLYAAGEVAGGLHGANRLGSVALTEIFVMGPRAATHAVENLQRPSSALDEEARRESEALRGLFGQSGQIRPISLIRRLQRTLWDKVGPVRTGDQCRQAIAEIRDLSAAAQDLSVSDLRRYNTEALDAVELRILLVVGEMIARSALAREETRGSHLRLDCPETGEVPENVVAWQENGEMMVRLDRAPEHRP